jgi:hypothetical protein
MFTASKAASPVHSLQGSPLPVCIAKILSLEQWAFDCLVKLNGAHQMQGRSTTTLRAAEFALQVHSPAPVYREALGCFGRRAGFGMKNAAFQVNSTKQTSVAQTQENDDS